jgi:hypothetical protein
VPAVSEFQITGLRLTSRGRYQAYDFYLKFDSALLDYEELDMPIVGFTPDTAAANEKMRKEKDTILPLLSDPQKSLLKALGLGHISKTDKKPKFGAFILDQSGKLLTLRSGKADSVIDALDRDVFVSGLIEELESHSEAEEDKKAGGLE